MTGRVRIDLSKTPADRMRHRLATLESMPSGTEVVVCVGAVAVEPDALRLLRGQERRLRVVIEGEAFNVPRWLQAIRHGYGELIL